MKQSSIPPIESVAAITSRLAVLLSAGVSQATVWRYLSENQSYNLPNVASNATNCETSDANGTSAIITAASAASVADIPYVLVAASAALQRRVSDAWKTLAAAWYVATIAGAPVAASFRDLASVFRELGSTQRDVAVALSGPVATARLVMIMPVFAVVLGMILGFDTVRTLVSTVPGWGCLVGGSVLVIVGARWNRRLMKNATPDCVAPGFISDLMAIAMSGGTSIDRARHLVRDACSRLDVVYDVREEKMMEKVLDLAVRAGVPVGELLRGEAARLRCDARSQGQHAAARLSVRLMLPLGICFLPAFMLVGVVPLLMSVLSSTAGSLL